MSQMQVQLKQHRGSRYLRLQHLSHPMELRLSAKLVAAFLKKQRRAKSRATR
jgi:hypothetical protein